MRHRSVTIRLAALVALGLLLPSVAGAQANTLYEMKEFSGGDLRYRTLIHLEYTSEFAPSVVMIPGFGLTAEPFRRQIGGADGWAKDLKARGYNAWMFDNVGVGRAQAPPDRDLEQLFRNGLFGNYQIGLANVAALVILHEQAAGMGLRARSFDEKYADALVLIDPIGPQGAQPMMPYEPETLLAQRMDPDYVWKHLGFGPARGVVRDGLDLSAAQAESLTAAYDRTQPAYWAGLLTRVDSNFEIREPLRLANLPVLVIRTPAADATQVEREEHLVRWMLERGMVVETWDLSEDSELKNVSGLPWTGTLAARVLDEILTWYEGLEGARQPWGR